MKTNIWQAVVLAGMILASCGIDDGLDGGQGGVTCDVHGKVEKGPFVRGSVVSVQPMDAGLQVSGGMYGTVVTDDIGNFVLGSKAFSAPYAEIMSTGYFFNEYTGTLSDGTLTLRALVELDGKSAVTSITSFDTGCTNFTLRECRQILPSRFDRGNPYFKSPLIGHPILANWQRI